MFDSLETQEPFSKDSGFQTGPPLRIEMDGKLMLTPDRPGITLWQISDPRPHQCNSSEKDKSQISSNGSDLSNSVKVCHQDFSTTKCHTQPGSDMKATWITQKRPSILSLEVTKSNKLTSASTPPLRKAELNSKLNSTPSESLPQKLSRNQTWCTHTNKDNRSQLNHISKESGDTTKNTL